MSAYIKKMEPGASSLLLFVAVNVCTYNPCKYKQSKFWNNWFSSVWQHTPLLCKNQFSCWDIPAFVTTKSIFTKMSAWLRLAYTLLFNTPRSTKFLGFSGVYDFTQWALTMKRGDRNQSSKASADQPTSLPTGMSTKNDRQRSKPTI